MKVLMCHNHYQQRGGECLVYDAQCALLERQGNQVVRYTLHNDGIQGMPRITLVGKTLWNRQAYRELRDLIRRHEPDVMHCTNTFPLISPAAYDAAREEEVPVVQSLHNYRLLCAGAQLLRNGEVCEACLGRAFGLTGVIHGCYRGTRAGTFVVAAMTSLHRVLGTWENKIDVYATCSEFARRKHIEGGLPASRIMTINNFVGPDPGEGSGGGGFAIFVGRLSPEKGLDTLLEAWERIGPTIPLKIVGDGPMAPNVAAAAARNPHIEWLGFRPRSEVLSLMGRALCLVMPSVGYEGMPLTILEAMAKGTPPIVSDLGAMSELIEHGVNGLRFRKSDAEDMVSKVHELHEDPELQQRLRINARADYLAKYTPEVVYPRLMSVYRYAIDQHEGGSADKPLIPILPIPEKGSA